MAKKSETISSFRLISRIQMRMLSTTLPSDDLGDQHPGAEHVVGYLVLEEQTKAPQMHHLFDLLPLLIRHIRQYERILIGDLHDHAP